VSLKEQYLRFRAWQREPRRYTGKGMDREQHCANCGYQYKGRYCPRCGQAAGDGRITWEWVRQSIMLLWGMDSRSMPYTFWQLLWRPGYLIGEYISGRRQVSYPPMKMLVLVALFFVIGKQLLGLESKALTIPEYPIINSFFEWEAKNPGWGTLSFTLFMTVPTWFLFRMSPRHTRHTWPEGVIIQIFISSLMLVASFLTEISPWFILLIPAYYVITYRQLFGYSWWGTLWRLIQCFIVWLILMAIIMSATVFLSNENRNAWVILLTYTLLLVVMAAILGAGYWIGKKNYRPQQPDKQK